MKGLGSNWSSTSDDLLCAGRLLPRLAPLATLLEHLSFKCLRRPGAQWARAAAAALPNLLSLEIVSSMGYGATEADLRPLSLLTRLTKLVLKGQHDPHEADHLLAPGYGRIGVRCNAPALAAVAPLTQLKVLAYEQEPLPGDLMEARWGVSGYWHLPCTLLLFG